MIRRIGPKTGHDELKTGWSWIERHVAPPPPPRRGYDARKSFAFGFEDNSKPPGVFRPNYKIVDKSVDVLVDVSLGVRGGE